MKYTSEEKRRLVMCYQSGESASSICSETGIPRSTFYSWIPQYSMVETKAGERVNLRDYELQKKHIKKLESIIRILKAVDCTVSSPLQDKLAAMEALYGQYSIHVLCDALEVPRGTFYNHIFRNKRDDTTYAARKGKLKAVVREIYDDNQQLFGADKITAIMREQGLSVSKKYVSELMREMGLYSISPIAKREYKKWQQGETRNVVQQRFNVVQPNLVWVGDITQYRFHQQYYYICAILDLFSRKVIAYKVAKNSSTQLVTSTFRQAYSARCPQEGLIFHSDRGGQYLSRGFQILLSEHGVVQSLSQPGHPHDNAVMESFFSYLKKEELYRHDYKSEAAFLVAIDKYIAFYNGKRPHSTLNYKTPNKVEKVSERQDDIGKKQLDTGVRK